MLTQDPTSGTWYCYHDLLLVDCVGNFKFLNMSNDIQGGDGFRYRNLAVNSYQKAMMAPSNNYMQNSAINRNLRFLHRTF